MTIYPNLILDALRTVRYPGTGKDIVEMGMVNDDIRIDGNHVSFSLTFEKPTDPFIKSVVKSAEAAILAHVGGDVDIKGNIGVKTAQDNPVRKIEKPLPGTWQWHLRCKATAWDCWMLISSAPQCPRCSAPRTSNSICTRWTART